MGQRMVILMVLIGLVGVYSYGQQTEKLSAKEGSTKPSTAESDRIVFMRGNGNISSIDFLGNNEVQITGGLGRAIIKDLVISPDRQKLCIAAESSKKASVMRYKDFPSFQGPWFDIQVLDLSTKGIETIITEPPYQPESNLAWSPRSDKIAYVMIPERGRDNEHLEGFAENNPKPMELVVIDLKGKTRHKIAEWEGKRDCFLDWSLPGNELLLSKDKEIFLCDIKSGSLKKLAQGDKAVRSPDGKKIAYYRCSESNLALHVMNADVSMVLTKIAFVRTMLTSGKGGDTDIYVIDADGKNQKNLTRNKAMDWAPAWKPYGGSH